MLAKTTYLALAILLVSAAATAQDAAAPPAAAEETMVDSPFFKVGWPKIEMPKFSWKPGFGGGDSGESSLSDPQKNPVSRALDKVADSSKKASDSVRNAWGSAMGKLQGLGGGGGDNRQVAKDDKPGFWSRLFAPEEPEPPRTMSEWIAQDRVGTTTR